MFLEFRCFGKYKNYVTRHWEILSNTDQETRVRFEWSFTDGYRWLQIGSPLVFVVFLAEVCYSFT